MKYFICTDISTLCMSDIIYNISSGNIRLEKEIKITNSNILYDRYITEQNRKGDNIWMLI